MAKYYRVTITTQLLSTFKVAYSTNSNPTVFNHTAGIWDASGAPYIDCINLTYNQLTDNNGLMVVVDDDVYRIVIEDENGYCIDCVSDVFGEVVVEDNSPNQQNVYITGFESNSGGSSFPVNVNNNNSTWHVGPPKSGRTHSVLNMSNQTIYVRLMGKKYGTGTVDFDAMAQVVYSSTSQPHLSSDKLVYMGSYFGSQNISPNPPTNPSYSGQQYYYIVPAGGNFRFGIQPNYYRTASSNSYYTMAFSTSNSVTSTQTEITRYTTQ
tara:strand:- start:3455 stop:4252 length:798 start_codon:yes stop_codon:yes gene_type:complete